MFLGLLKKRQINSCTTLAWVAILSILGVILFAPLSFAQDKYPTKAINIVQGFAAGGTTDVSARPLIASASKILNQPIVIINKPGGATSVATAGLKNEKPNGYNIGILSTGAIISQHMRKVPYDTREDFTPIMQYAIYRFGLVVLPDSPWRTFKEFIGYAKANPGKVRYGSGGLGTVQHLVMERLALAENIKWTHIPFEGGAPNISALLGGHVDVASEGTDWKKYVESGRLRLLVVYGEKRMSEFPEVPTLLEMGYEIIAPSIIAIVGPKGLSPQVVETLHGAFKKAMNDQDFIRVCYQVGQLPVYRDPQDLSKFILSLNEEVGTLIRKLGLRKE